MAARRGGPIAGIVLAAGGSVRMGRDKLLLEVGGESLLRRAARRAIEAGLDPVLVVLGDNADAARGVLAGLDCSVVVNREGAGGQGGSVRAGLEQVPGECEGATIVLADMPLVSAGMIASVVKAFRGGGGRLAVSDYGGVLAPPMTYARSLFAEVMAVQGDGCGKRVIRSHSSEADVVPQPPEALLDIDTPDDYQRLLSQSGARAP